MSEKGGDSLSSFSILRFLQCMHRSGEKPSLGSMVKTPYPQTTHLTPQRCLPAGPSQQARLTDPVPDPPHPDVRDEGGLESASCSHTRSIQGPALVPRPDYLHVRFFTTRPCGAGRPKHHTSRELRPRCPLIQSSAKKKPPGHILAHDRSPAKPKISKQLTSRHEDEVDLCAKFAIRSCHP